MKFLQLTSVMLLALIATSTQAQGSCVLPAADGGDEEPSPPSIVGVIAKIRPGEIWVKTGTSKPFVRVAVRGSTQISTVYGGGIEESSLRQGQHTLIWLEHCQAPGRAPKTAAVVQICSLAAEPCPGAAS